MIQDKLMINGAKTEFVLIGTKPQLAKVQIRNLSVGGSTFSPNEDSIRNLGAWFDSNFTVSSHINKTSQAAYYHLYNINRIRKFLNPESRKGVIHALITSRLDYCNSLLYG